MKGSIGFVILLAAFLIIYASPHCCLYEILITHYPVIFKFRDGTGRVIEKKIGSGRVPGSRQTLVISGFLVGYQRVTIGLGSAS